MMPSGPRTKASRRPGLRVSGPMAISAPLARISTTAASTSSTLRPIWDPDAGATRLIPRPDDPQRSRRGLTISWARAAVERCGGAVEAVRDPAVRAIRFDSRANVHARHRRDLGGNRALIRRRAGWPCVCAAVHAVLSLRSSKAAINLEYLRLNYQLATEINLSSLNSVPDAEVGPQRM